MHRSVVRRKRLYSTEIVQEKYEGLKRERPSLSPVWPVKSKWIDLHQKFGCVQPPSINHFLQFVS